MRLYLKDMPVWKIALAAIAIVVIVALSIAVAILAVDRSSSLSDCQEPYITWYEQTRCKKECSKRWDLYPVIMVSLDGFRADYLNRNMTKTIKRLMNAGSYSEFMYASYPSKTFPNHYSIVTGLYPEAHGIIDNSMYDASVGTSEPEHHFSMANCENPKWWLGEPLWNTVQLNGLKSAAFFWPGSDKKINGMQPTYWNPWNISASYYGRIDQTIEWLSLPDDRRPSLINLYFDEPDGTGHNYGPDAHQVNDKLVFVDGLVGYLMEKLEEHDFIGCVNIIISADHGMQLVTQNVYLSKYINTNGMKVFDGPVARIMLNASGKTAVEVANQLSSFNLPFRVYTLQDVPKRLHFSASVRIGDLIIDGDPGVKIWNDNSSYYYVEGDHGYDYKYTSMHALFFAVGPSIKSGYKIEEPFQNIELYNLVADLLKLNKHRAPNNGTDGVLHKIQVDPPPLNQKTPIQIERCTRKDDRLKCCDYPKFNISIPASSASKPTDVESLSKPDQCWESNAHYYVIFDKELNVSSCVRSLFYSSQIIKRKPYYDAVETDGIGCAEVHAKLDKLNSFRMSLYPLLPITNDGGLNSQSSIWMLSKWKCAMYTKFYENIWLYLMEMVRSYAKLYGNVMVYAGPIFDYDYDGLADSKHEIMKNLIGDIPIPTHFFCIIVNCSTLWTPDNTCTGETEVMSFILPHQEELTNLQSMKSHIFMNTAKVRDIELLSGVRFFDSLEPNAALKNRLHINQRLWPLN